MVFTLLLRRKRTTIITAKSHGDNIRSSRHQDNDSNHKNQRRTRNDTREKEQVEDHIVGTSNYSDSDSSDSDSVDFSDSSSLSNNEEKEKESIYYFPFLVRARHRLSFDATSISTSTRTLPPVEKTTTKNNNNKNNNNNEKKKKMLGGHDWRRGEDTTTWWRTTWWRSSTTKHDKNRKGKEKDKKATKRKRLKTRNNAICPKCKAISHHRYHHHDHFQQVDESSFTFVSSSSVESTTPSTHDAGTTCTPGGHGICTDLHSMVQDKANNMIAGPTVTTKTNYMNHDVNRDQARRNFLQKNMQSFPHFHQLMDSSSQHDEYDDEYDEDGTLIPSSDYCPSCRDNFLEGVRRKSTSVDKMLHQVGRNSFDTTYSSSEEKPHHQNFHDDQEKRDEKSPEKEQGSTRNPSKTAHTPSSFQSIHASRFSVWRSTYNSKIMPNRVILVRHGQSEGNVNEAIYAEKPDSEIQLTKLGWEQARMAGMALKQEVLTLSSGRRMGPEKKRNIPKKGSLVHFIVSPYVRTMETFHGLASAWCDPEVEFGHVENENERKVLWYNRLAEMGITWHEDPRIREQDFGNYQEQHVIDKAKVERFQFGAFYYRFPNGESASDVYDRASTFLDSLWRSFDANRSQNYVLGEWK